MNAARRRGLTKLPDGFPPFVTNERSSPNATSILATGDVSFTSTPAVHLTSIRDVQSLSTNVRRIRWGFTAIVQVTARNRKVVASAFAMGP